MERRDFVKTATASIAAMSMGSVAMAAEAPASAVVKPLPMSGLDKKKLKKVIEAAQDCLEEGQICHSHCVSELAKGDTMMAECFVSVQNVLASCEAMVKIASNDSLSKDVLLKFASACADICESCAKACEPHVKHHKECRECMEACKDCAKACRNLA